MDISTEISGDGIGRIAFARPAVSNAVRPETMRALCEAIDAFTAEPAVRAIVLTGEGRNFAAGADFGWLGELLDQDVEAVGDNLYAWFRGAAERLWTCPKPTVAAVNGAAITVGCELALVCDARVATPRSRFGETWFNVGLMPPLGGTLLLPRFVGLAWAKRMILEAEIVDGAKALEIGLVDELVDEDRLLVRAGERALAMAAAPPAAFAAAKAAIHRGVESTMADEWARNVPTQAGLICSDAFRDRVEARLKKT
ncbi:MAG TPA: enoyl-CoA hydratase/isomerase family protein [Allosphingosinicella sp.]|nr:enoyl-CoA hydratase/isomerase family protein [Allosphingosinicella sp.]